MVKKILLNRRSIPVPVPVKTGADLVGWLESTFLQPSHVITKLDVDRRDVLDDPNIGNIELNSTSTIEVQIDSPVDLALHSLDAVTNLGCVVLRNLKPLAVASWQTVPTDTPEGLEQTLVDLRLLIDLGTHSLTLMEASDQETKDLLQSFDVLRDAVGQIDVERDWQEVARILLNKVEPTLMSICQAIGALQSTLFSNLSAETLQRNL